MKKRFLSLALALGLCLSLFTVSASAAEANTPEEIAALGVDLSFSTEVLDFGTAEYREGGDLFPQTLSLSVTNHGSEELRYYGWNDFNSPVKLVSEEGLTTITISEEAWVVPPGAWITYPVDARWIMPGDTATFRCCHLSEEFPINQVKAGVACFYIRGSSATLRLGYPLPV